MSRFARSRTLIAVAGLAGTAAAVAPAVATTSPAPAFSKAVQLKGYAGGEPSLALDPLNSKNVYVTAPQAIPSAANRHRSILPVHSWPHCRSACSLGA